VNIVFGDYPTTNSSYIDGASDYEAVYGNWFRQAPRQLTHNFTSGDIPEHVRELVLRRELCTYYVCEDYEYYACLDATLFDDMLRTGSRVLY
jgi:hypothetical protein